MTANVCRSRCRRARPGTVTFPYTITDGNGGSDTATVRIARAPRQSRTRRRGRSATPRRTCVQNGHVVSNVLGDWVDPDGDPVYLESANASNGDRVSTTPDGLLDFRNDSGRTGDRVGAARRERRTRRRPGSVTVRVAKQGSVPLRADPFPVQGYAGKAFTVEPLDHVRGGNGTVTLTSVSSASGLTVTPSYDAGTFRVQGRAGRRPPARVHRDRRREDVERHRPGRRSCAPPDASTAPITTPKTVFVNTLSTKDTDVTATDIDPAGGVLLVTALDGPGPGQRRAGEHPRPAHRARHADRAARRPGVVRLHGDERAGVVHRARSPSSRSRSPTGSSRPSRSPTPPPCASVTSRTSTCSPTTPSPRANR